LTIALVAHGLTVPQMVSPSLVISSRLERMMVSMLMLPSTVPRMQLRLLLESLIWTQLLAKFAQSVSLL
jgi:hypothetical protein